MSTTSIKNRIGRIAAFICLFGISTVAAEDNLLSPDQSLFLKSMALGLIPTGVSNVTICAISKAHPLQKDRQTILKGWTAGALISVLIHVGIAKRGLLYTSGKSKSFRSTIEGPLGFEGTCVWNFWAFSDLARYIRETQSR